MKVEPKDVSASQATARVTTERAEAVDASITARRSVEASTVSSTVAAARAAAGRNRLARVAQLRDAVKQGSYRPDPGVIAEQILADANLTAQLLAMLQH